MTRTEELIKAKIPCAETGIEIRRTLCDICCPSTHCGIDAYVKDGKIIKIEGTKEHPFNKGSLCAKGSANRQYLYREDRLQTPMRRVGKRGEGKFEPISWDEAYRVIAENLLKVKAEYGPDSVAFFTGYTKWYRQFFHRFAYSFGSINYGSESSSCYRATCMAWDATAGEVSKPDLKNTNVLLGFAANPFYSRHVGTQNLYDIRAKGGKIIIIDPRETPTTQKVCDLHLQIRPGTDGALALGIAKIIIDNGWQDQEFIDKYTHGYREYKEYVQQFDLEKVSKITGLRQEDIYKAAEIYATNGPATIHESSCPITHHIGGFNNYRAMICLHALTGNYDRAGGSIPQKATYYDAICGFETREHEYYMEKYPHGHMPVGGQRFPLWHKLVHEMQAMDLSRQIREGTPYPIKAVFALGMNAKMFPDTKAMYTALETVDFFADTDLFMTDTAKYADILLPACSSFERGEFKCYAGGYATFTNPVIEPLYESKNDVQILTELAHAMEMDDDLLKQGYEAYVDFCIRDLDITIDQMKASDLPIKVPGAEGAKPGKFLENGFPTPSGKFEFWSVAVEEFQESHGLSPLPIFTDPLSDQNQNPEEYPFVLVTGARLPNAIHSRLHGVPWLRSMRKRPMADLNPADAEKLGIAQEDEIALSTGEHSLTLLANLSHKILPGTVHIYHGYTEANANDLVGGAHLDPYSGYAGYRSNRCRVTKINT